MKPDKFWKSWRMMSKIGCAECDYTGYLEARDERGLCVSWPCDCRKRIDIAPIDTRNAKA